MVRKLSLPPSRRMLSAIPLILLIAGILITVAGWIGAKQLITPHRRPLETRHLKVLNSPSDYGLALEAHEVTTADGIILKSCLAVRSGTPGEAIKTKRMEQRLRNRGIQHETSPGTVIFLHGRSGRKENMLAIAERFVAARYRCIVYDARSHGESGGYYCTFGKREVEDLITVIHYYRNLFQKRGDSMGQLCAFGNSLGASVILQALAEENAIDVALTTAPFADLNPVIRRAVKRNIHPLVPEWLITLSLHWGGRAAGFDPFSIQPWKCAQLSTTPLFIVHGRLDGVIPVDHSRQIFAAAAEPKQFREIESGYHHNVLAEGGDDLYEEMILFCLEQL